MDSSNPVEPLQSIMLRGIYFLKDNSTARTSISKLTLHNENSGESEFYMSLYGKRSFAGTDISIYKRHIKGTYLDLEYRPEIVSRDFVVNNNDNNHVFSSFHGKAQTFSNDFDPTRDVFKNYIGVNNYMETSGLIEKFHLRYVSFNTVKVSGDSITDIRFTNTIGKHLQITDFTRKSFLHLENSDIDSIYFQACEYIPTIAAANIWSGYIVLDSSKIQNVISFKGFHLPDSVKLNRLIFENSYSFIDFSGFIPSGKRKCKLILKDIDVSKIKLNYAYFQLDAKQPEVPDYVLESIYKAILDEQKKEGYSDGLEKIDKEYKRFKYIHTGSWSGYLQNWIEKLWWDYGYHKIFIVRNSLFLMMVCFIINLTCYRKLIFETYIIEEFKEAYINLNVAKKRTEGFKIIRTAVYCLVYTAYIFWGFKISLERLKLKNLVLALWVITQYTIGIICLAYLANFIITR